MKSNKEVNQLFLTIALLSLGISLLLETVWRTVSLPLRLSLALGEILILLPAAVYVAGKRIRPFSHIQHKRLPVTAVLLLILFTYSLVPVVSFINSISLIFTDNAVVGVLGVLQNISLPEQLLLFAVLPALLEEFVFRGLIYHTYRRGKIWSAVFASSLLFGLMHMNLNQFCYAAFLGVVLSLSVEATGSILASMLIHFIFNANSVILSQYSTNLLADTDLAAAAAVEMTYLMPVILGLGVIFIGATALAVFLLHQIAAICGRKEHMRVMFSREKRQAVEMERETEPVWDRWLVLGAAVCIAAMVL